MLYFSKFRILLISIFTFIFVLLTLSNFTKFDDNFFDKKINLGLDLQGGSYLLLEIDNKPVILKNLQNTILTLRKYLKEEKISFKNLSVENNDTIEFEVKSNDEEKIKNLFESKESEINPYYPQYKSHQFDLNISKN